MKKKVLFLEGHKDQAKSIAEFLKLSGEYTLFYTEATVIDNPEDYDVIVPSGADSTSDFISRYGDLTIGQITYSKSNLRAFNKILAIDLVKSVGVPVPLTYLDKSQVKLFPVFYKSLKEQGYAKRGIIRNELDLMAMDDDDVFFQEFIWSKGTYSVGFLADRGKVILTFPQKELLSYPYHGGSGVILQRYEDRRLIEYTERIVEVFNYSGWGLTEFKYCTKRDDYVFMELNAKFWASLKFAFENKPEFLEYLFGLKFKAKHVDSVIYIDRVILSDWEEIRQSIPYLFKSQWVKSQSILKVIWKRIKNDREGRRTIKMMSPQFATV